MGTEIVLVDDDELFRESLGQNLRDAGFSVVDFDSGPPALDHLLAAGNDPDLLILDWKMPGMNGIEVLKRLRSADVQVPAIFLTALTDQIYEEAALATGAVDFVEKSRSFAIVSRRIELILAGARARPDQPAATDGGERMSLGPLSLRFKTQRAEWRGKPVDLTLTEFRIVRHMAENAGHDVSYRDIYDIVHGAGFVAGAGEEGYRANVRTFVKRIRQKFRAVDGDFDAIHNYAGFGYAWKADGH